MIARLVPPRMNTAGRARSGMKASCMHRSIKAFGHIDPVEALFADPVSLDESQASIKRDVFRHHDMCIEINRGPAAPPRLGFREGDQAPAQSLALGGRCNGDVVEQNAVRRIL